MAAGRIGGLSSLEDSVTGSTDVWINVPPLRGEAVLFFAFLRANANNVLIVENSTGLVLVGRK